MQQINRGNANITNTYICIYFNLAKIFIREGKKEKKYLKLKAESSKNEAYVCMKMEETGAKRKKREEKEKEKRRKAGNFGGEEEEKRERKREQSG